MQVSTEPCSVSASSPIISSESFTLLRIRYSHLTLASHAEKNYEDVARHENTVLAGLCSGLFAAAAIASTPSLSTLVPVAVQAVLLSFRTGLHVATLAERLCPPGEQPESWTLVVPNIEEHDARIALDKFHDTNVRMSLCFPLC